MDSWAKRNNVSAVVFLAAADCGKEARLCCVPQCPTKGEAISVTWCEQVARMVARCAAVVGIKPEPASEFPATEDPTVFIVRCTAESTVASDPPTPFLPPAAVVFDDTRPPIRLPRGSFLLRSDAASEAIASNGTRDLELGIAWHDHGTWEIPRGAPEPWTEAKFVDAVRCIVSGCSPDSLLDRIQSDLSVLAGRGEGNGLHWIQRLLIGLLGHHSSAIRVRAEALHNCLVSGNTWFLQQGQPTSSTVCFVGDPFEVAFVAQLAGGEPFLVVQVCGPSQERCAPGELPTTVTSWLLATAESGSLRASGANFALPGFTDWRAVSSKDGRPLGPAGRFIVLPAEARLRPLFVPLAELEQRQESPQERHPLFVSVRQTSASDRSCTSKAAEAIAKVVSSSAIASAEVRIGISTKWHRKYRGAVCLEIVADSQQMASVALEDEATVLLNYRSLVAWDLLVQDVLSWARQGAARIILSGRWPTIASIDSLEMHRLDEDGELHHPDLEIFETPLVDPCKMRWVVGTGSAGHGHPIFAMLARRLWVEYPHVVLAVEAAGIGQCEAAAKAGLVPVDIEQPQALACALGMTTEGGRITSKQEPDAETLSQRLLSVRGRLPRRAVCFVRQVEIVDAGSETIRALDAILSCGPWIPILSPARCSKMEPGPLAGATGFLPIACYSDAGGRIRLSNVLAFALFDEAQEPRHQINVFALNLSEHAVASFVLDCELLCNLLDPSSPAVLLADPLDPMNPSQLMSRGEFVREMHMIDLKPLSSLLWHVGTAPTAVLPAVLEQSVERLANLIQCGVSPVGNAIYEKLVPAIASAAEFERATSEIAAVLPPQSLDRFGRCLQSLAFHLHSTGLLRASGKVANAQQPPATALSLLESCAKSGSPGGAACRHALELNEMKTIVLVSAEVGRFSTVGGVGVVVDELSRSLAKLNFKAVVISPYYNFDKYGHTGYLPPSFKHVGNITAMVGPDRETFGVWRGKENGVDLVFLHSFSLFPSAYAGDQADYKLRCAIALAKGALQACLALDLRPSIVVSNDWPAAMTPAYASYGFGAAFKDTKTMHIIHNAEKGYDGKLFFDSPASISYLHQLPAEFIQDSDRSLNLTMVALKTADNWGTVSKSYHDDLKRSSAFAHLMSKFQSSFAWSNGIRCSDRLAILRQVCPTLDHWSAKRQLQEKYFDGCVDPRIPLFGFVGRLCEQKGVELLIWVAHELIAETRGRIQFLIGGFASSNDPYAAHCAHLLWSLRSQHPRSLWAEPNKFFLDGAAVNIGCDFAVMPSVFEPSGIVQQEAFVAGCPVVAFKTGGLKDTVFEYNPSTRTGNGFTFEAHCHADLRWALVRAMDIFANPEAYNQLRSNAEASVLDMSVCATAWANEFCRMCGVLPKTPFFPQLLC